MRQLNRLVVALLIVLFSLSCAFAEPVKRKVLVLYNSAEGRSARGNSFVEGFAAPLNYLGFLYEVRDVAVRPLPSDKRMSEYGAVFTTFSEDKIEKPDVYLSWLIKQQNSGKKVIIAGSLGAYAGPDTVPADPKLLKQVFSNLGFSYQGNATHDQYRLKYESVDPANMNFERKLPLFPERYVQFVPQDKGVESWVTVALKGKPDSTATAVGVGPHGGFALDGYMRWQDEIDYQKQWYLNPFEFLRICLDLKGVPALTPTTLNGKRVAFAHIDGDGFAGYTEIDKQKVCGEIVMERIFERYDFPNSASVIAGEINPAVKGSVDNIEIARTMFEMSNVETSSHSYTHPYAWNAKVRESKEYAEDFVIGQYEIKGYKFDAQYEIVDSCDYISENLAPLEKPCKVLFWSGMCDPTEEQVAIADKAGILNMNGGDTVFDARRNSYFGVSPLYRALGKHNQIYTGQANENILTNLWSGPFFGFRNIVNTMKRTGSPRRIMPIDIYYHFYSGEKFASLKALEDVYEWALSQDAARVFASAYIKMVNGCLAAKVGKLGTDRFVFRDYADCLSVRLDGMERVPDLAKCKNVLGYDIQPEGIFVHLRPGTARAEIVLSADMTVNDNFAYLKNGSGWVRNFERTAKGVHFDFECFSKGNFALGGLAPGRKYKVLRKDGPPLELSSNGDGILQVNGVTTGFMEIDLI
ncbi:polysaccharide deacetylase [Desulfovibrio sp. JC022]|uniref:polysaccharide deacetylase family protein n=1 Tax=Desulfovibrio sp. JC022 TaxID=2593642 RepID=UPI0013D8DEA6|nr:polysaccharide deacetylase [Desulfovibrio sp. JC022]NDV22098.1 polysaccharide deacetylase [Desulfovibrio sp. JC022]